MHNSNKDMTLNSMNEKANKAVPLYNSLPSYWKEWNYRSIYHQTRWFSTDDISQSRTKQIFQSSSFNKAKNRWIY